MVIGVGAAASGNQKTYTGTANQRSTVGVCRNRRLPHKRCAATLRRLSRCASRLSPSSSKHISCKLSLKAQHQACCWDPALSSVALRWRECTIYVEMITYSLACWGENRPWFMMYIFVLYKTMCCVCWVLWVIRDSLCTIGTFFFIPFYIYLLTYLFTCDIQWLTLNWTKQYKWRLELNKLQKQYEGTIQGTTTDQEV